MQRIYKQYLAIDRFSGYFSKVTVREAIPGLPVLFLESRVFSGGFVDPSAHTLLSLIVLALNQPEII
jgi:hypothetical protein